MGRHVPVIAVLLVTWALPWTHLGVAADVETLAVNKLLDNILTTVQRELERGGLGTMEAPDWAGSSGSLRLSATEGMMSGMSSIYRSDRAVMEYGNGNVSLGTSFSLPSLQVGYRITADYSFLSRTADVGATVNHNQVHIKVGMFYSGDTCYIGVEEVSVRMLADVQWRVSGFGPINALVAAAINVIVPPSRIRGWLNPLLQNAMSRYRIPCHNLLPGIGQGLNWNC